MNTAEESLQKFFYNHIFTNNWNMSLLSFLAWNVLEDVAEDIEREEREESASYETDKYNYDREDEESDDSDSDY